MTVSHLVKNGNRELEVERCVRKLLQAFCSPVPLKFTRKHQFCGINDENKCTVKLMIVAQLQKHNSKFDSRVISGQEQKDKYRFLYLPTSVLQVCINDLH